VKIWGPLNVPSTVPVHATQMYAKNISTLLNHLIKDGLLNLDFEDEIVKGCVLTHDGQVRDGSTPRKEQSPQPVLAHSENKE